MSERYAEEDVPHRLREAMEAEGLSCRAASRLLGISSATNMRLHGLRFRLSSDEPIAPYRTKASRPTPASDTEAGR